MRHVHLWKSPPPPPPARHWPSRASTGRNGVAQAIHLPVSWGPPIGGWRPRARRYSPWCRGHRDRSGPGPGARLRRSARAGTSTLTFSHHGAYRTARPARTSFVFTSSSQSEPDTSELVHDFPNEPPELNLGSECWVLCFIVFQNTFYYGCRFKFLVFQISLKTRKIDRWVSHLRVGKVDDRQAFDVQSIHKNVTEGKVAVRYCPNLVRTLLQFLKSLFETRHLKTWFMLSETLQAAPRLLEFEFQAFGWGTCLLTSCGISSLCKNVKNSPSDRTSDSR